MYWTAKQLLLKSKYMDKMKNIIKMLLLSFTNCDSMLTLTLKVYLEVINDGNETPVTPYSPSLYFSFTLYSNCQNPTFLYLCHEESEALCIRLFLVYLFICLCMHAGMCGCILNEKETANLLFRNNGPNLIHTANTCRLTS